MNRADVVIVGGGVIGCAIAHALAGEGLSVALLERDTIGAHASRVSAGMLTPFSSERDALPLGRESLARYPEWTEALRARSGVDPGFVGCGLLRVAWSEAEAARLRARAAALAGDGVEWLDAEALPAREPALAPGVLGATWSPREGYVDPPALTRACARAAAALGARIEERAPVLALRREGARVVGVRSAGGDWSAGRVVLATGPWAGAEAAALGLPWAPPVEPVRGQILTLRPAGRALGAIAWDERVYLVPRPDGRVLAGATEERVGFDCRTTEDAVRELAAAAAALAPALAGAPAEARAGLRPATPDGLPCVGPAPGIEGLLLAVGHHRHGVLLAPETADLIAALVAGRSLPPAARAFAPERFVRA